MTTLPQRLRDEADLCRNDGADDIAKLLDEAAYALAARPDPDEVLRLADEMATQAMAFGAALKLGNKSAAREGWDRHNAARAALVKLLKGGE